MDEAKKVHDIITAVWKACRPYLEQIPMDDARWEEFVRMTGELCEEMSAGQDSKAVKELITMLIINLTYYVGKREEEVKK